MRFNEQQLFSIIANENLKSDPCLNLLIKTIVISAEMRLSNNIVVHQKTMDDGQILFAQRLPPPRTHNPPVK